MTIHFKDSKDFTVGVELEVQLLDRTTLELAHSSSEIIGDLPEYEGFIKHELMMSNLEIISGVCSDVNEAETDLRGKARAAIEAAANHNTTLNLASTHPFSSWRDQRVTEDERYLRLIETLQIIGRRFNIFGQHVHVGVAGGERCIYIMNRIIYYLPYLLAISANSPFWEGEDTGISSYRTKVFESLPVAGLPFYFRDWDEYTGIVKGYLETGTIRTIREIWWDARPHPDFGTIEVRICDIPPTIREAVEIAALVQALVKKLSDDYDAGVPFVRPHSAITRENKWRACRYGIGGSFILEDGLTVVTVKDALLSLIESVMPQAASLGSVAYLRSLADGFESGTGADRQLRVWKRSGDLKEVVRENARQLSREVCPDRGHDL
jgi:carboxylate-amine ligase